MMLCRNDAPAHEIENEDSVKYYLDTQTAFTDVAVAYVSYTCECTDIGH